MRRAVQQGGLDDMEAVLAAIEDSGALEYTAQKAREQAARAIACLDHLPAGQYRDALVELTEFAVARTY